MSADACSISRRDLSIALTLGVAFIATLSALIAMPSVMADSPSYDGEIDLYGYKITMGLIEPDQVSTVEWDFGDGTPAETVTITGENPVGRIVHTYSEKGDYIVTATMRNQYTDSTGEIQNGESKLTYLYHIHGYPVVTFDSQGGSSVPSIEGTSSHYVPTKPADPVKSGYGFSGWFTDADCTTAFDWTSEVTKHVTLYAGWDTTFHTVSFDYNGGNGTASDISIAEGNTVSAPADPVKDGFDFAGWYLGDAEFDFSTPITSDIILVAHWTEKADVPSDPPTDGDDEKGSSLGIVFLVIAVLLIIGTLVTGIIVLGIPAVVFAILAVASYLGVL